MKWKYTMPQKKQQEVGLSDISGSETLLCQDERAKHIWKITTDARCRSFC